MFERYTEKARRVIFFARYEASQFGSPFIETEHLLLGLLREDKALTRRFLSINAVENIRLEIQRSAVIREKTSTSADLPLSNESQRVLAYSAEEAERLNDKHIGTEHLFLALLREEKSLAARTLQGHGVNLEKAREELARAPHVGPATEPPPAPSTSTLPRANLVPLEPVFPLIGRENELDRILQILGCYNARNPVLVGELGVGKRTIVGGLAQRIADGNVPLSLADASIVELDLPPWGAVTSAWFENFHSGLPRAAEQAIILVVDDLHTPADSLFGRSAIHLQEILKRAVVAGQIQCISVASPANYTKSIADHGWLDGCFQPIRVVPATEDESLEVVRRIKQVYEEFHHVRYTEDALSSAVACSSACIVDRCLPGKAVDVMDEAGSVVQLRNSKVPEEIIEVQKRLRFIVKRMNASIENHEFEKARFYSEEERKERKSVAVLREEYRKNNPAELEVTVGDIEGVVARWTGTTVEAVRKAITAKARGSDDKEQGSVVG